MRRLVPALLGAALAALPRAAAACPSCAGREDAGLAGLLLVGGMILFPFAIAAVLTPVIRKSSLRTTAQGEPPR